MKKILITGGTGFIGRKLISFLVENGYEIAVLTRNPEPNKQQVTYYYWNIPAKEIDPKAFEDVEIIINLVGENIVSKRWTKRQKEIILSSRVDATRLLYDSIAGNHHRIHTIISSSAVGYYGTFTSDTLLDETMPDGNDFLAGVCRRWEEEALRFTGLGIRTVIFRKGMVLGRDGGAYRKMASLAGYGLNASLGKGNQYMPWIHLTDLCRLYKFAIENEDVSGVYNAVSGEHIDMNKFSAELSRSLHKKILTPNVPAFVVKLLYGEMSSTLLKGSRVSNRKIIEKGFQFRYNNIREALKNIAI